MPIYEYRCKCCQHAFEALIWNSGEERDLVCPACRSDDIGRLLSSFSKCSRGSSSGTSASSCGPSYGKFG